MIGLLEGPEPRTDRVIDRISGVSHSCRFRPSTQPVHDGRASLPGQLAPRPAHSQTAKRGSEMPCVPTFSLLTRTAKRITPVAHSPAQTALRTGQISQGIPDLDSDFERPGQKEHQVALRECHNLTCRKRNTRCNTTTRSCSPTTGPATHRWPPARYAPRTLSTPHARATSCGWLTGLPGEVR